MSTHTRSTTITCRSLLALCALLGLAACMSPPKPVVKARQTDATRAPQGAYDSANAPAPSTGSYSSGTYRTGTHDAGATEPGSTEASPDARPKRSAGSAREYVESFENAR